MPTESEPKSVPADIDASPRESDQVGQSAISLLRFPDGETIHQTFAWVVPGPEPHLESIEVRLDPPPTGTPCLPVGDLKAWFLSEKQAPRSLEYTSHSNGKSFKRVTPTAVFSGYVKAVLSLAGLDRERPPSLHLLMPSLPDELHFRYLKPLLAAVKEVMPAAEVSIVPEPEMILEFFRLVRRMVRLRTGENSFFLVVDAGASTANFTVVISTRGKEVTEAKQRRRTHHLRPVSGDAALLAGYAIDNHLLQELSPDMADAPVDMRSTALRAMERAKVLVARGAAEAAVPMPTGETVILTQSTLRFATMWLWSQLERTFRGIAQKLLDQLRASPGKKSYAGVFEARGVRGPEDVAKLFDAVFIAGGTSRLPGFEEDLRATLGLPASTPIHSAGGAFPVAAVLGGLAHGLRRVQVADGSPEVSAPAADGEPVDATTFAASMPWNLVLDCKDQNGPSTPARTVILRRSDPAARLGGHVEFPLPDSWKVDTRHSARVVPSISDDFGSEEHLRRGARFVRVRARRPNGRGSGTYDPELQRLTLRSNDASGLELLHFTPRPHLAPPAPAHRSGAQSDQQAAERPRRAKVVVLDIGMSKTVLAHGESEDTVATSAFDDSEDYLPGRLGFGLPTATNASGGNDSATLEPDAQRARKHGRSSAPPGPPTSGYGGDNSRHPAAPATARPHESVERAIRPGADALASPPTDRGQPAGPYKGEAPAEPAEPHFAAPAAANTGPHLPSRTLGAADRSATNASRAGNLLASPLELMDPATRIRDVVAAYGARSVRIEPADVALLYLALCTRPFVLLAGPPGSGKSTLARTLADVLCGERGTFVDIPVQAHWVNDEHLFQNNQDEGPLKRLLIDDEQLHIVLFDEINLTRPEYYLSRLFGALENHRVLEGKRIAPLGIIGTLNIDDFSRPPSPKVLDRAMLLMVEPTGDDLHTDVRCAWASPSATDAQVQLDPPRRRGAVAPGAPSPRASEAIAAWLDAANSTLKVTPTMRTDLLPSRRAAEDLRRFMALHSTLALSDLVPETAALDEAILGRFVSAISGSAEEVTPLLQAWNKLDTDLPRTRRRISRLLQQAQSHGYASFWQ